MLYVNLLGCVILFLLQASLMYKQGTDYKDCNTSKADYLMNHALTYMAVATMALALYVIDLKDIHLLADVITQSTLCLAIYGRATTLIMDVVKGADNGI